MLSYALLLSLKNAFGFRTFLDPDVLANLQYYFKNINQIPHSMHLCFNEYPWQNYLYAPQFIAQNSSLAKGCAINYVEGVSCFIYSAYVFNYSLAKYTFITASN